MSTTEVKVKIGLEGAQQVQTGAQAAAQAAHTPAIPPPITATSAR